MEPNQSKNFQIQLLEDLPAGVNDGSNTQYGKSIGAPFSRQICDTTIRIEVFNYTSKAYKKGDIVFINVDNYGFARVIEGDADSDLYVGTPYGNGTPELKRFIYATGDSDFNQLAAMGVTTVKSSSAVINKKANPFNFRPVAPCLFANVKGFGYYKTDDSADPNQPKKAYNMVPGYIPVAQDARLHFTIPANDQTVYNYGDLVFVTKSGDSFIVSNSPTGSIVAICDSEKKTAVNYDFYMPFKVAGFMQSIDEAATSGVGGSGERYGFSLDGAGPQLKYDETRGDFINLYTGQQFYSPLFVDRFRVVAGTNYPVAVEWYDGQTNYDIELSLSNWLSIYGPSTLQPEICSGDIITAIVDASGTTPKITPIQIPMDFPAGTVQLYLTRPNKRLWQAVDYVNDWGWNGSTVGGYGAYFNATLKTDPAGTELDIRPKLGAYVKVSDNTVLVQGQA